MALPIFGSAEPGTDTGAAEAAAAAAAPTTDSLVGGLPQSVGILRANLQSCSLTDVSASNGVLHVLDYVDPDSLLEEEGAVSGGSGPGRNYPGGEYTTSGRHRRLASGSGDSSGVRGGGSSIGVIVPDVLELTYALGFRRTYEAIVSAAESTQAAESEGAVFGAGEEAQRERPIAGGVGVSAAPAGGTEPLTTRGVAGDAVFDREERITVAEALRGEAPHTLLAVRDGRAGNGSDDAAVGEGLCGGVGRLSEDTLR